MRFKFVELKQGRIIYETEYAVLIDDIPVPLHERSLRVVLPETLYSLPSNDKKAVNTHVRPKTVCNLDTVLQYWGKYPIGSTVSGIISNGQFIVSEVLTIPKDMPN